MRSCCAWLGVCVLLILSMRGNLYFELKIPARAGIPLVPPVGRQVRQRFCAAGSSEVMPQVCFHGVRCEYGARVPCTRFHWQKKPHNPGAAQILICSTAAQRGGSPFFF